MMVLVVVLYMLIAILATALTTVFIQTLYVESKSSDKKNFLGVATLIVVLLCLFLTAIPFWKMTQMAEEAFNDYGYANMGATSDFEFNIDDFDFSDFEDMTYEEPVVESVDLMAE